jgi:hypothetical protein
MVAWPENFRLETAEGFRTSCILPGIFVVATGKINGWSLKSQRDW